MKYKGANEERNDSNKERHKGKTFPKEFLISQTHVPMKHNIIWGILHTISLWCCVMLV